MEFPIPDVSGFVVFGKTGCSFCDKVKALISSYEHQYTYINCDTYLAGGRDAFLEYIESLTGKQQRTFPMVFFYGKLIGGYTDTIRLLIDTYDNE
jgi:hypothetical protein